VLFAAELARRLEGIGVTSNLVHPGGVRTDIMREMPWLIRSIVNLFFIDPQTGAKTSIMLASDPALENVNGKYYDQCKPDDYAPVADDRELCQRLWAESEAMVAGG
jgi:NAD(P)-dependent dehydrogenase (short-subunit alcohol dehydrogenase family)